MARSCRAEQDDLKSISEVPTTPLVEELELWQGPAAALATEEAVRIRSIVIIMTTTLKPWHQWYVIDDIYIACPMTQMT